MIVLLERLMLDVCIDRSFVNLLTKSIRVVEENVRAETKVYDSIEDNVELWMAEDNQWPND
jgi:hypothetical protein